ncbi:maltose/maltodextrin ABC transporter substrate-binding protein MalE, partial [Rhizobacter sp. Root1238]|uniref:maltose/maltodextrin ABC transporter substrate-binding protein MalE n=1 Tax=Rhizobacter sp. Root1238 TaxID=1736435 RepID=UPI001F45A6A0
MNTKRHHLKLLAGAAVLALAGTALPVTVHAAEPGKLLIWINGDKGYNGLAKVGEEFTAKTGVQVVVEHPEDAPNKFQQAAAAGKGPDIWIWPHDRIGEWIAGGLLQPVTPSKKVLADLDPLAVKAFAVGGKQWGYPMSIEAVSLVYNKALVPTPPKTFDEVASGKKAILWDYNNTYFTWPLLAAGGGYPFKLKADGNFDPADTGVNNAGALKGAELLNKLVKDGVMTKGAGYAEMEAGMAQGKVAMMINGPWSWDNLKKANIDFGVAKIPSVNGKKAAPFVGVLGAMISKASPNRDVAVEFIENFMLAPKGLKTINDDVPLGTPASKAL